MAQGERHDLAVFIDFENIALGLRGRADATFDVHKVIQRLLEIGNVLVKRAYADWSRFGYYTRPFHEAAIELIEIPRRGDAGKNSADIRLCVDAMDLCYAKGHVDTFVIVSGDSDFSPLVSKLRENGKRVIGLGLRGSTSNLLVANCDEFIYYESIDRHVPPPKPAPAQNGQNGQKGSTDKEALRKLVAQTVSALLREGRDPIQASLVKDTIKRKDPSFNETEYGCRSFTEVLEDAQEQGLITMIKDARSGTYLVSLPKPAEGAAPSPDAAAAPSATPAQGTATAAPTPAPAPAQQQQHSRDRDRRYRRDGRRWEPRRGPAPTPAPTPATAAPTPAPAAPVAATPAAEQPSAPEPAPAADPIAEAAPAPATVVAAPETPTPKPEEPMPPKAAKPAARSRSRAKPKAEAKPAAKARTEAKGRPASRFPAPPVTRPRRRIPPNAPAEK